MSSADAVATKNRARQSDARQRCVTEMVSIKESEFDPRLEGSYRAGFRRGELYSPGAGERAYCNFAREGPQQAGPPFLTGFPTPQRINSGAKRPGRPSPPRFPPVPREYMP